MTIENRTMGIIKWLNTLASNVYNLSENVKINNISVKYQVSRNENALGFNNQLGFNSQLGLDITDDTPYISERDE